MKRFPHPYPLRLASRAAAAAAAILSLTLAGVLADARAEEVSFAGKRINVIIGTSPGGGTDGTTRLLGRFLEVHLPGKPQMVYRNMPAGHGVQATNYFALRAERDGTAWMGGGNAYIDANTLRKQVVQYDPTKFNFIGGVERGGSIILVRKTKLANLTDKSLPPVVVGTPDGSDTWAEMITWGADKLGWNVRFVIGYPGTGSLVLALRRGEIDSFGTSNLEMLNPLLNSGEYAGVAQNGRLEHGAWKARAAFPDVPPVPVLLEGKLDGAAAAAFDYWIKSNQIDKWYALPPETPAEVVRTYVAAFGKAVTDPEFIKTGQHQFGAGFTAQSADDMTDLVRSTSYPNEDILNFLRGLKIRNGLPAEALSDEELAKLRKKLMGEGLKVTTRLTAVENGGRELGFMAEGASHKARVSGSRTKVSIAGKEAPRGNLKPGMTCDIAYASNGGEAMSVACK